MGAAPTAVLLKQKNGWTYGILANDIMVRRHGWPPECQFNFP